MPLIPSPINRVPRGLLDFLGIRTAGRNPQHLTEQLLPVVDLDDWYKASQTEYFFLDFGAALAADTNSIVVGPTVAPSGKITIGVNIEVPSDQIWLARKQSSTQWTLSSGTSNIDVILGTQRSIAGAAIFFPWPMSPYGYNGQVAPTTMINTGGRTLDSDLWLGPGDRVVMMMCGYQNSAAETADITGTLALVRMRL